MFLVCFISSLALALVVTAITRPRTLNSAVLEIGVVTVTALFSLYCAATAFHWAFPHAPGF